MDVDMRNYGRATARLSGRPGWNSKMLGHSPGGTREPAPRGRKQRTLVTAPVASWTKPRASRSRGPRMQVDGGNRHPGR